MATVSQAGTFNVQEFTDLGALMVGGRLYTYAQGTTTQKTAYTDAAGTVPHTYTSDGLGGQYIALNSRGELPGSLYLTAGAYDICLKTSAGATVWTRRADALGDANVFYTPPQSGATATTLQAIAAINFNPGNATAVAGGVSKIDALMEAGTPNFPAKNIGGYWPSGPVYVNAAISSEFTSATSGGGESPAIGLLSYVNNNNSSRDIVGIMSIVDARTNNDVVFAGNLIATNEPGTTNTRLVGLEIDIQPATGTTVNPGGAGLYINAFTLQGLGAAIQIDGVFGGSFSNGVQIGDMTSPNASGLAPRTTAIMDSLINTGAGTYTTGAILISNTHRIRFNGTALAHAYVYNDASNFLRIVGGSAGTVIRNSADNTSLLAVANGGVVSLSATGTINWDAAQTGTTVGAAGGASALPATPTGYVSIQIAGVARRVPYYA